MASMSPPLANVPKVFAVEQGGLLDVILDRDFAVNHTIYSSYAEPFNGGGRTALARAALMTMAMRRQGLLKVKVIYRQRGPASRGEHFGSRIVQASDGNLFVTNGETHTDRDIAQTLDNDLGKIVHIAPDGAPAPGNPCTSKPGAVPEIWSLWSPQSTRNPLSINQTASFGSRNTAPWAGDEINLIVAGHNYGWPLVCYGVQL